MPKPDMRPEAVRERMGLARESRNAEMRRERYATGKTEADIHREANEFVAERVAQATPGERDAIARAARKNGMHVDALSASEQAHQIAAETGRREEKN